MNMTSFPLVGVSCVGSRKDKWASICQTLGTLGTEAASSLFLKTNSPNFFVKDNIMLNNCVPHLYLAFSPFWCLRVWLCVVPKIGDGGRLPTLTNSAVVVSTVSLQQRLFAWNSQRVRTPQRAKKNKLWTEGLNKCSSWNDVWSWWLHTYQLHTLYWQNVPDNVKLEIGQN